METRPYYKKNEYKYSNDECKIGKKECDEDEELCLTDPDLLLLRQNAIGERETIAFYLRAAS